MYSAYFTHKDGSFFMVINLSEFKELYEVYDIPNKAKWLVVKNYKNKAQYTLLDEVQKTISIYEKEKVFNPLKREWYKQALNSTKVITIKPYIFASIQELGTTYIMQTNQKGTVLGIDFTMKKLSEFLSLQTFEDSSEVFMFNKKGQKFVSSEYAAKTMMDTVDISTELKQAFLSQNNNVIEYKKDGKNYLAMYQKLGESLFLGIKVDTQVLLKPYIKSMQYSLGISLILLLLSIPIIFFAVSKIVKPIKALIQENEKIKNRKFDDVSMIKSNIIEFRELSKSQVAMSHSISEYQKSQAELLDAIVKLIAEAIDAKSPYTGGHCARVPKIAQMLVNKASGLKEGAFKEFTLESPDALREFEIGAWLHDCGKVTTPEYVVDKSTKLETIYNRIHEIRTRFEVLWRDAQIAYLESKLNKTAEEVALETLNERQKQLVDDFEFIASVNIGGEFMSQEKQKRIQDISNEEWTRHFDDSLGLGEIEKLRCDTDNNKNLPTKEKLLSDKKEHIVKRENFDYKSYAEYGFTEDVPEYLYNYGEVYNLCIQKGTLSAEERYKINEHVIVTIKMLEKIPFPSHMVNIPEYAGTHHETLIGTGYPRGLTKDELSIPARIMALADVFEALTASDRPYKKAKTLSESIKILSFMVKDQHLDADVFELFLSSGVYKVYAHEYLKTEQIDDVDIQEYLNA
ncbi:amino acid ABC transporter [Sulfurimonas sp. SAG-AH-194-C21]|nr:amino acid ABC transporter [Sulfurimonas sp. SAG-AH-194-C21]